MLKLKALPRPELFLHLMPDILQARFMETLLNRMFPDSVMQELQAINGKEFLFCTPNGELRLMMCIEQHHISIHPHHGEVSDVTIRGDLIALTALCLGLEDSDSLFFSRRLLLTGDTSTGLLFKNILTRLDFDLRLEL
ncbi:MAG: SCP2 domain-containing protein, partial [Mariprofundaceae bacterium]